MILLNLLLKEGVSLKYALDSKLKTAIIYYALKV